MTVKTIYDSAGMIVRVVTLTGDPVEDAIIEDVPVGGASVEGDYDSNTVYFVASVATARPAVDVDLEYEIVADGEDSFWFEVPDETRIHTPEGQFDATAADDLVSISSRLVGTFRILIVPPLPYQKTAIQVSVIPDDGGSPNLPPTTPDIEILLSQSALTGLTVLAKPKFNVVTWDESSDPEHDHYGLTRYESEADADADVDGVDIEPITETFYKDADEFVNGVDCWYRVWDVDGNGNRGDKSDPVGEVARGVQTQDVEPAAIVASKYVAGDTLNAVRDPDMADLDAWIATAAATFSISAFTKSFLASNAGFGGSRYFLAATATGGTDTEISTGPTIPVEPGDIYDIVGYVGPASGSATAIAMYADYYEQDASGNFTLNSSDSISHYSIPGTVTYPWPHYQAITIPADCTRMGLRGETNAANIKIASFSARRRRAAYFQVYTSAAYGSFSTTIQTIQTQIVTHGPRAAGIEVSGSFRNTSGAGRTFLVELYAGGVLIAEKPNYVVADNDYGEISGVLENPDGDTTTITLKVTSASGSNNVANRRLICKVAR